MVTAAPAPLLRKAGKLDDESGLHLLTLDVLLLKTLGPEALLWDSEVLHHELGQKFGSIGPITWGRIQAARILHVNNLFWLEWEVFEKVCAALCGRPVNFTHSQPPEAEEIAVTLMTAKQIETKYNYSDDVKRYLAAALLNDGVWFLEEPLSIIQPSLDEYDRANRITRDRESVRKRLGEANGYVEVETFADAQVNHVLSVREALKTYDEQVKAQLAKVL